MAIPIARPPGPGAVGRPAGGGVAAPAPMAYLLVTRGIPRNIINS
ncbi:hypothetical protein HMPREF9005_1315 [Actinomyces sp. oral taxon 178 str. F0338]|nr:hypothetical protein HMPREF9005_1315 [Actinomyces sp. oral taxon 178 str. F0338]